MCLCVWPRYISSRLLTQDDAYYGLLWVTIIGLLLKGDGSIQPQQRTCQRLLKCLYLCASERIQGPAACRYRKLLHHLAVGFCVSPPRRIQHGGAFTRLHFSTPHFPSQHVADAAHAHCTQLPRIPHARTYKY